MFESFYPDETAPSAYDIDYESLYQEGYRGILFDIDNTLVEHGADADDRAVRLFARLKSMGFRCCLISNNKEERVARFNCDIGAGVVYKAGKPSTKGYIEAMEIMHTDTNDTVFIGDQLFTDIYGAKRSGLRNILVKPIDKKEEIQIVLKRRLEWFVLREYKSKKIKKRGSAHVS